MALWIESFSPHGITQFSLYEGASNKIIIWVDRLKQFWQSRLIKATAWWKILKRILKYIILKYLDLMKNVSQFHWARFLSLFQISIDLNNFDASYINAPEEQ